MITSASNQRIKQVVQWQSKAKERRRDGVFVVEGIKMYLEAPAEQICEVYVSAGFMDKQSGRDMDETKSKALKEKLRQTGYEEVAEDVFARMSDTKTPQGILAVLRQPAYDLEDLLSRPNPLFLLLENLQDPGNLGTIMRTGEGAGITGVIMSGSTVDIFNPKVIRSTMGSIYRVPFLYAEDLKEILGELRQRGIRTYAAHLKGEHYYSRYSFRQGTAFLIGNEGNGLSDELSEAADAYVKIPMEGQVESLNAAVSAALLLYEAHRQRAEYESGKSVLKAE